MSRNMVFVSVSLCVVKASFSLKATATLIVGPDLANLPKVLLAQVYRRDVKPQRERDAAYPDGAEGGHETVSVEQLRGEQSLQHKCINWGNLVWSLDMIYDTIPPKW